MYNCNLIGKEICQLCKAVFQAGYSGVQLEHINAVRMHHGVTFVSDLCNTSGTRLNRVFYHKSKFLGQRNKFLWPESQVERREYDTWMELLHRLFPQGRNNIMIVDSIMTEDQDLLQNWDCFVTED